MSSMFLAIVFSVDGGVPDLTAGAMCFCSTIHLGWNEHMFLNEEHFPPFLVLIVLENESQPQIKINLSASSICVRLKKTALTKCFNKCAEVSVTWSLQRESSLYKECSKI
jgi:hypothetical protein